MNRCFSLSGKNITISTSDVAFKIPDCDRCERAMTDVISNFKGVESCTTDTENQKIAVTGSFNLEKLLKKLTKVTGNEVEIVKEEPESEIVASVQEKTEEPESEIVESVQEKTEEDVQLIEKEVETEEEVVIIEPNSDERKEMEKYMMFSDENPNAKCTIS